MLVIIMLAFTSLSFAEDMNAHNKRYDYRNEIKMPSDPSQINVLLGVDRKNWSTFGSEFGDCHKLNEWLNEDKQNFIAQNKRKSKKYLTDNEGNNYTKKESDIETTFYSCLSDIRFTKAQVVNYKKYRELIKSRDIPRILSKHKGFNEPKYTLRTMIRRNINDNVAPDKKDIYLIDVYRNSYVILQMIDDNTALFYDTQGKWPAIYFIAPDKSKLKEGATINNVADYYTFEGVYSYKNSQGFDRQAYIIRGHLDHDLRTDTINYFYAKQWVDGDVNIDGM